ncbi:hypothetical protein GGR51DRAFT_566160 [Nemania sp. FL0031]|nr:hypothetical protein GGR51DRAFT_566160 [Nemania sp. FL0031]
MGIVVVIAIPIVIIHCIYVSGLWRKRASNEGRDIESGQPAATGTGPSIDGNTVGSQGQEQQLCGIAPPKKVAQVPSSARANVSAEIRTNNIANHITFGGMDNAFNTSVQMLPRRSKTGGGSLIILGSERHPLSQGAKIALGVILGFCALVIVAAIVIRCLYGKQLWDKRRARKARDAELGQSPAEQRAATAGSLTDGNTITASDENNGDNAVPEPPKPVAKIPWRT